MHPNKIKVFTAMKKEKQFRRTTISGVTSHYIHVQKYGKEVRQLKRKKVHNRINSYRMCSTIID